MALIPHTSIEPAPAVAYRAITLCPDGNVLATHPLSAGSDEEAAQLASALVEDRAIELWDGLRFIEHFEPKKGFRQRTREPFHLARANSL